LLSFTDMSLGGESEDIPLQVTSEWPYVMNTI
jgi:hypothetical protein